MDNIVFLSPMRDAFQDTEWGIPLHTGFLSPIGTNANTAGWYGDQQSVLFPSWAPPTSQRRGDEQPQTLESFPSARELSGNRYEGGSSPATELDNIAPLAPEVVGVLGDAHTVPTRTPRRRRRKGIQEFKDDWEQHRSVIKQLYLGEEMCLEEVILYMGKHHNFYQKAPAYKRMFSRWGFCKNTLAVDMKVLAAKAYERRMKEGKASQFFIHDRLLDSAKLKRFIRRHNLTETRGTSSNAAIPPYVRCITPPTESATPSRPFLLLEQRTTGSDSCPSLVHTPEPRDGAYPSPKVVTRSLHGDLMFDPRLEHAASHQDHALIRDYCTSDAERITSIDDDLIEKISTEAFELESTKEIAKPVIYPVLSAKESESLVAVAERLPCGIYKPPSYKFRDWSGNERPDSMAASMQGSKGNVPYESDLRDQNGSLFADLHRIKLLCQHRKSPQKVLAKLERNKDTILYELGPKHELFLHQALELGLVYEKLSMGAERDGIIKELTHGYHKFWLPSDPSRRTDEEIYDSKLPSSDFQLCQAPVNESCACDQLRDFAYRNRARMPHRSFRALQSRAIACYFSYGRIDHGLICLIDVKDAFSSSASTLGMRNHILSVLEVLESHQLDGTCYGDLSSYLDSATSKLDDSLLLRMLHSTLRKLGMGHQGFFRANISLATAFRNCQQYSVAEEVVSMLKDHVFEQLKHPKENTLAHQSNLMVSARLLANHYKDQRQWHEAEDFVARLHDVCNTLWGPCHPETLQARQLVHEIRCETGRNPMFRDSVFTQSEYGPSYAPTDFHESDFRHPFLFQL